MKDVVKFIFGEISGTMEGQEYYKEDDENSYIVPGDMRLTDFYNLTNFDIEDPVMSTIGGVAFRVFDGLPQVGDKASHEGYEFTAREVTGLRISKVQVTKKIGSSHAERELEEKLPAQSEQVQEPEDAGDQQVEKQQEKE